MSFKDQSASEAASESVHTAAEGTPQRLRLHATLPHVVRHELSAHNSIFVPCSNRSLHAASAMHNAKRQADCYTACYSTHVPQKVQVFFD